MKLYNPILAYGALLMIVHLLVMPGCGESNNSIPKPSLEICKGEPDSDGDGVCDKLETSIGLDPNNPDTDGDFFNDGSDFNPDGTGRAASLATTNGWIKIGALAILPMVLDGLKWLGKGAANQVVSAFKKSGTDSVDEPSGSEAAIPPLTEAKLAQIVEKVNKGDLEAYGNPDESYIGFFSNPLQGSGYTTQMISKMKGEIDGVGFNVVILEYMDDKTLNYDNSQPGTHTFHKKPIIDRGKNYGTDSISREVYAALKQVEDAGFSGANPLAPYSGVFVWLDPGNTFTAFDHEGVGYKPINGTSNYIADAAKEGRMRFSVGGTGSAVSLPQSGIPAIPARYINVPSAAQGTTCSSGGINSNDVFTYGTLTHYYRCFMTTFSANSSGNPAYWVRLSVPPANQGLSPWEGQWFRVYLAQ